MKRYYLSPFLIYFNNNDSIILFNQINHAIIEVNKDLWNKLLEYINNANVRLADQELIKLINDLQRLNILVDYDINRYKHNIIEFRFNTLTNYNGMEIWFAISGKCNFVCPYCYQAYRKDGEVINDKRVDKFINFVKNYVDQNNIRKIYLVYYGGEPLLAFNEIIKIHNELVNIKLNKNISLEEVIITNGSLLTEDKIEKLVELSDSSPIGIQITIDGMKEVMDKRRPLASGGSSFNLVYNNFIKLAKKYPFDIFLRSNVNYDNIEPVRKLLLKIKEDMGYLVDKVVFSPHWTYETQEVYMKNKYYLPEVSQAEAMELIKQQLWDFNVT